MADGSTKPIGEVRLGDKVLATDTKSGRAESKRVSVLHHNRDADLADVTVKDRKTGKKAVLHTTWHHPFFNAGKGQWTDAQDLKVGDRLRSPDGESTQTVAAVKVWTGLKWMQDLTVNDDHTYYVVAGNTPVLVHNSNCVTGGVKDGGGLSGDQLHDAATAERDALARNLGNSQPGSVPPLLQPDTTRKLGSMLQVQTVQGRVLKCA